MSIVYFDSQIFRELKKEDNKKLLNLIKKLKNKEFLYCYSDAHLYDLKNDNTEMYKEDLNFMKDIVDDNYIYFDVISGGGFKAIYSNIFDRFNSLPNIIDIIDCQDFTNFDVNKYFSSSIGNYRLINNIMSFIMNNIKVKYNNTEYTFGNIMNNSFNKAKEYLLDNKAYKKDRRIFKDYLNKNNNAYDNIFLYDNNMIFNYIKDYMKLDLSNDIAGETKFRSMVVDALHSFYSIFSNYLITNDKKLHDKKILIDEKYNIKYKIKYKFNIMDLNSFEKLISKYE